MVRLCSRTIPRDTSGPRVVLFFALAHVSAGFPFFGDHIQRCWGDVKVASRLGLLRGGKVSPDALVPRSRDGVGVAELLERDARLFPRPEALEGIGVGAIEHEGDVRPGIVSPVSYDDEGSPLRCASDRVDVGAQSVLPGVVPALGDPGEGHPHRRKVDEDDESFEWEISTFHAELLLMWRRYRTGQYP